MERVTTPSELSALAGALTSAPRLFLDTEFHSAREGHTLSLVQVSDGERIWVVDALTLRDLRPLAGAFTDHGREWVLHAGRQDAELLVHALGLDGPPPVFDTQVAWALVGPEWSASLAYCLFRALDVRGDKSAQVDDWLRRPLPDAQWIYAGDDVRYLPDLHRWLEARLAPLDRRGVVHAASAEQVWPPPKLPEPLTVQDFRHAWQLDGAGLAALQFLIGWFNGLADDERRAAPGRDGLFAIAGSLPPTGAAMARLRPVPSAWARRHGDAVAGRVLAATQAPIAHGDTPEAPAYATFPAIQLEGWFRHACAEVATQVQMAPELAFPKGTAAAMRVALASDAPRADAANAIDGWRREILAPAWRAFCKAK